MMPGDEVYELTGDGTISLMKHAFCVFFNQTMLDSLGVSENMYDLVRSGKWTIDKLTEYAKLGYSDVNGNTEPDFGDKFGLTFGDTNKYLGFQMALGGVTALKGKDGGTELDEGAHALKELNCTADLRDYTLFAPVGQSRALISVKKQAPTPQKYPRTGGVIKKKPL